MFMPRKSKSENIKLVRFFLYFFLIGALCITYFTSKNIIKPIYGHINATNWVKVDAKLLSASIKKDISHGSISGGGSSTHVYYTPKISYEYTIYGQDCRGSRVNWNDVGDDGVLKELAYLYKSYYKSGKSIVVFANPDKKCESIADKSIYWSKLINAFLVLLLSLGIASGIFYTLRKLPKN
jgi:hypothetical protein